MAERVVIEKDEFAVKLTSDISGGVGNHKKDTVLRNLSRSAFNTIICGGFGKRVMSTEAGTIVDYADVSASPVSSAPKGSDAQG